MTRVLYICIYSNCLEQNGFWWFNISNDNAVIQQYMALIATQQQAFSMKGRKTVPPCGTPVTLHQGAWFTTQCFKIFLINIHVPAPSVFLLINCGHTVTSLSYISFKHIFSSFIQILILCFWSFEKCCINNTLCTFPNKGRTCDNGYMLRYWLLSSCSEKMRFFWFKHILVN